MTRPKIIAHRVLSPGAIENARSSLARLRASGADLVEMDVRLSLDRRPFVTHDAFLGRTTRGHGWIRLWPSCALRWVTLRNAGDGEHLATLRSMLESMPGGLEPALHVKDRGALRQVLRTVRRHGNPGTTWLWLEHPADVYTATRTLPETRCTLLRPAGWTVPARQAYFQDAQRSGARGVSIPWGVVTPELVRHARQHHLQVFSRIDTVQPLAGLLVAGVDGIITDDPGGIANELQAMRSDGATPQARCPTPSSSC